MQIQKETKVNESDLMQGIINLGNFDDIVFKKS